MPRYKAGTIICIINIDRISFKALLHAFDPVRRRVNQPPDIPLILILQRKTALVDLALSDPHHDPGFRKYDFRLRSCKVSFCKTFDLVFHLCSPAHLFYPLGIFQNSGISLYFRGFSDLPLSPILELYMIARYLAMPLQKVLVAFIRTLYTSIQHVFLDYCRKYQVIRHPLGRSQKIFNPRKSPASVRRAGSPAPCSSIFSANSYL